MSVSIKREFKSFTSQQEIELKRALNAVQNDLDELRTKFIALLAKMDADFANVTNASVDYESTTTPAALTLTE
jgi:hypothetical protein